MNKIMDINKMMNFADGISTNENLRPLMDLISLIMEMPEENLNEDNIGVLSGMINGAFTEKIRKEMIQETIKNFREENYSRKDAQEIVNIFKQEADNLINELKPSENKKQLLNSIFQPIYDVFETTLEKFNLYDIELPIQLESNAKVPTYAHEDDAAADIYALEDTIIPAHSISNMVKTGVRIGLPEGWAAIIIPRSSIGMKTGLRLSNSQGLIDPSYRGPLGVIYDNISDSDYEIKAGDRIAQIYVVPVHRFRATVVDVLPETERGEGGFGSTGK